MPRKPAENSQNLVQYATKVDPVVKATLTGITQVAGKDYGQRELLNEMLELYREKHPERLAKVDQLIEIMGVES